MRVLKYDFIKHFVYLGLLLVCVSCKNRSEEIDKVMDVFNDGLVQSNEYLLNQNRDLYKKINANLKDPVSHERAKIWEPKALVIRNESRHVINYLDSMISILSMEKFYFKKDNSDTLLIKLLNYRNIVHSTDYIFKDEVKMNIMITDSLESSKSNFYQTFFSSRSKITVLASLNNFKKLVLQTENGLIVFCHSRSSWSSGGYEKFSCIVGQSSNIVERGEEIEITAGVGEFSRAAFPTIFIDGKIVELNENNVAMYKYKATGDPGRHSIAVKIDYTTEVGLKSTKDISVQYRIKE